MRALLGHAAVAVALLAASAFPALAGGTGFYSGGHHSSGARFVSHSAHRAAPPAWRGGVAHRPAARAYRASSVWPGVRPRAAVLRARPQIIRYDHRRPRYARVAYPPAVYAPPRHTIFLGSPRPGRIIGWRVVRRGVPLSSLRAGYGVQPRVITVAPGGYAAYGAASAPGYARWSNAGVYGGRYPAVIAAPVADEADGSIFDAIFGAPAGEPVCTCGSASVGWR